jgi:hypothetical protein
VDRRSTLAESVPRIAKSGFTKECEWRSGGWMAETAWHEAITVKSRECQAGRRRREAAVEHGVERARVAEPDRARLIRLRRKTGLWVAAGYRREQASRSL